ncbi:MAG: hypothetical protein ACFNKL_06825 [Treponema sp.]
MKDITDTFTQFCYAKLQRTGGGKTDFTHFNFFPAASSFPAGKLV